MKNTNYKGKTNEELAIGFLNSMVEKEKKTEKHFKILLTKYKAWDKEGVDDIVNQTIEKVYNIIMRKGLKDGYFQAYFETALENNLKQYLKQANNKNKKTENIDNHKSYIENIYPDRIGDEELEYEENIQLRIDKMLFAFNQLPESSKEMINMILDKQKYKETQRSLGLTEGQVKMRTRKARAQVVEFQNLFPIKTWEKIKETNNYSVSRSGQIRDDSTGKILKIKSKDNDYQYIMLPNAATGELEKYLLHDLVYLYHGDEHERKGYVYHIDKNIKNNHIDNLLFDCI